MIARHRRAEGFTLVELLVTIPFLLLVAVVAGTIIVSALRLQSQVSGTSGATSQGELVARSVEAGVRNSSSYLVGTPDASGDQLLRARVAVGVDADNVSWMCQAWYFDATAGEVRTTTSATPIADVTAPSQVSAWRLIATGIAIDGALDADGDGVPDGTQIFSGSATELRLEFVVTAGDVALVLVPSTIVQQLKVTGGTGPSACF